VRRIGAPPLIALATAVSLLALGVSALLLPGFVMPAEADTTTPTSPPTAPAAPGAGDVQPLVPGDGVLQVEAPAGNLLVTLPWGDGPGQVGLARAEEGLTRGPEALAVAPDGRIAILDSVNSRLVLLGSDGSFMGTLPLRLSQARFVAVDDELLYVLDADTDRRLICLDWQGALVHDAQVPVLPDAVTGLFVTDGGASIEIVHDCSFLVEFSDDNGKEAYAGRATPVGLRPTPGRPVDRRLEKAVKVMFTPEQGVRLKHFRVDKKSLQATQARSSSPVLPPGVQIEHLVSVDGDGRGGLIMGARLLRQEGHPADEPSLVLGRLAGVDEQSSTDPLLADTLVLTDSAFAYLGQPYVVSPDGRIYQPVGSDSGYAIRIHSLPGRASLAEEVHP
jgi:hypothetical protein